MNMQSRPETSDPAELEQQLAAALAERDELLAQQTATSDILRVISQSPTDLQPVFDATLENATRICKANFGMMFLTESDAARCVALYNVPPAFAELRRREPVIRPGPDTAMGRLLKSKRAVHIEDATAERAYLQGDPVRRANADLAGARTIVAVPMLKNDEVIGAIGIFHQEVRPFTPKQLELVTNFANQAVIAIENARLFNETRQALDRQTATAEILRIISRSPTDVQPVFDAIVQTAVRLLGCDLSGVLLYDGSTISPVTTATRKGLVADLGPRNFPFDPAANFPSRAILAKENLYLPDWSKIELPSHERQVRDHFGMESGLYLPLLREGECIGVLFVGGTRPDIFGPAEIALAESFRDQALIAIDNTRLFGAVQARTAELSQSLDTLRAAQDRLVQTEKLASLGQLTAGIAHEIKNPLNFVNNFAALSTELVGELNDALAPASLDPGLREEVDGVAAMLKANLEKIVQHGQRADSIVKNMLLHSREGGGEHRPADINALVEESLNLAYHGARAERPSFNVTLKRDLDPTAGMADVYPQEMTRVLLNLISNGFYATAQRKVSAGDGFEPILSAATKNLGDHVEIRIRDNGTGIPQGVKEKMFNPFFTTKPAGEGTGLGLSMSHDIIVKQHGGKIDVRTEPGVFTEFIITLPRTAAASTHSGGTL
jgi:signal transduction histidine kinase